jgi:hypothetical protein
LKDKGRSKPRILICGSSDCAKRATAYKKLKHALGKEHGFDVVKCQKICRGPVVGIEVDGSWEWFSKITKSVDRDAVLRSAARGKLAKRLKKRWVKKRSGKRR